MRLFLVTMFGLATLSAALGDTPRFVAETIDGKVAIGYGVALEDVDGDGRVDILLADQRQFVWYQNPSWKRHVMAENLTERDNVCLAARDIDGDGRAEVAVGAEWNPGDTVNSGAVFYLIPPDDRTQKWTPVKLHHEPVVHRMRWVRIAGDQYRLVVAPLHGRGNRNGDGAGVRLLAYEMPADPQQDWNTVLMDERLHITHNFDRGTWGDENAANEAVAYLGKEGATILRHDGNAWQQQWLDGVSGGGEIRMGMAAGGTRFLATIEPFHGDKLVAYPVEPQDKAAPVAQLKTTARVVVDDNLSAGHAVATGDFMKSGKPQIVAGWRSPNRDGKVGVKLYYASSDQLDSWQSLWIDDNGMACEDLRVADLDGDGRLDIVAAGRGTHNLKVYWNRPQEN